MLLKDSTPTTTEDQHGHSGSRGQTYEALGGVIHQAELETLLIFKSFRQGVSQAVGGKHALPALLELAEDTLEKQTQATNTERKKKKKKSRFKMTFGCKY